MGIKENENKNSQSTEEKVKVFMKRNLKMMDEQVDLLFFFFKGLAFRWPCLIVAMLTHYKIKCALLQQGREHLVLYQSTISP